MIRIKELFRLQHLKNMRLIAGQEGLERAVSAAVLLEYDPTRMQLPDFYRGDLVVTTLAYARGDSDLVAQSLQALMNQGIAGLLVKTAYFTELPQSVVALANHLGTPLFLFDETYIEEVILEVTDLIRGKRHFSGFEQELDALMRGGLTAEQVKSRVQRIDPAGCRAYRIYALYPRERMNVLEDKLYVMLSADAQAAQRMICMQWRRMMIVLCHQEEERAAREEIDAMLREADVAWDTLCVGASESRTEQSAFGVALCEAVYSARAARLDGRELVCAQELGLYAYLFPMSENAFVCEQCRRQLARIRAYDSQNRTSLEQTAKVYVQQHMEIAAAAKALYQHPNTVRYRLTKIQHLMELEDEAVFTPMISLMVHLTQILEEEGRA